MAIAILPKQKFAQKQRLTLTQTIDRFAARGQNYFWFACHAAVPLALTPDLLYGLWAEFQQDAQGEFLETPWMAVSDLLFSGFCKEVGTELYEMESEARAVFLARLQESRRFGMVRLKAVAGFVLDYGKTQLQSQDEDERDLAQVWVWSGQAYCEPEGAARSLMAALVQEQEDDGSKDIVWLAQVVEGLRKPLAEFPEVEVCAQKLRALAFDNEVEIGTTNQTKLPANFSLNQRITNIFRPRRFVQGLQLRWHKVFKGNQIWEDSVPFQTQAVFLIHHASGCLIAEAQQSNIHLEGDVLAGVLTATRHFGLGITSKKSFHSELNKIDYDGFKIITEVAGSCYIAAITQGNPPGDFLQQLRHVLSTIITNYNYKKFLETYNGDLSTVPEDIQNLLTTLIRTPSSMSSLPKIRFLPNIGLKQMRRNLSFLGLLLVGIISWQAWEHFLERRIQQAIRDTPVLAVYRLNADVHWRQVVLTGAVPSPLLKSQAGALIQEIVPNYYALSNQVETPETPPPPEWIEEQVQRATADLSERLQTEIVTIYNLQTQTLTVQLPVVEETQRQALIAALQGITGVETVVIETVRAVQPWGERIYFDRNEDVVPAVERDYLDDLATYLKAHPDLKLRVIGHTDQSGDEPYNEGLAQRRADAVKQFLIQEHDIDTQRLSTQGDAGFPPGVGSGHAMYESRCVRFELANIEMEG